MALAVAVEQHGHFGCLVLDYEPGISLAGPSPSDHHDVSRHALYNPDATISLCHAARPWLSLLCNHSVRCHDTRRRQLIVAYLSRHIHQVHLLWAPPQTKQEKKKYAFSQAGGGHWRA